MAEASTSGRAVLRDGKIVISIDVDALPLILSGACAASAISGLFKVTDAAAFGSDVCRALNQEAEDGTTRVHAMFDSAFDHAINQGAEGIAELDEDQFEEEASLLQVEATAATPDTSDIEKRQAKSVAEVRELAELVHGDQTYGDQPYVVHLDAVAAVLSDWGFGGFELQAAAYLHDVIEDTDVDHGHLSALVTPGVADIVWACTGEGETRDERMAAIYAKVARNGRAAVVKLADRVANLQASESGSHHALRYAGEHAAFSAALKPVVPRACWDRYVTAVSRVLGEPVR